jgi:DNA-binding CsgD family transcriptional regulator
LAAFAEALGHHKSLGYPFALARTQLVQGEVLRRAKQRKKARAAMTAALEGFESLGAELWAARAREEQGRLGGRAAATGELTPTEKRVADLVVEGKRNREIAAIMFLAVRTVDSNLERGFHKLGVRNRAELAVKWAEIRRQEREEAERAGAALDESEQA